MRHPTFLRKEPQYMKFKGIKLEENTEAELLVSIEIVGIRGK